MTNLIFKTFPRRPSSKLAVALLGLLTLFSVGEAQAYTSDLSGGSHGLRSQPGAMPTPFPVPLQMQPLPQPFPRPPYERPRY